MEPCLAPELILNICDQLYNHLGYFGNLRNSRLVGCLPPPPPLGAHARVFSSFEDCNWSKSYANNAGAMLVLRSNSREQSPQMTTAAAYLGSGVIYSLLNANNGRR